MKAVVQDRYGSPEVLELRDVEIPEPAANEVLVRVRAAGLNQADWYIMRGEPYLLRLAFGLRAPKMPIRGRDVAGVVEAVGAQVSRFLPGDEVYAETERGTFAVQIAQALGADVTGVCSTRNVERACALGADRVVDYTRDDFVQLDPRFDVILDLVGNRTLADCRRALAPQGTLVLCAPRAIRPAIEAVYPLAETRRAMRHLGEQRARAKIVVTV